MNREVREAIRYLEHAIDHAEGISRDTAEMDIYSSFWTAICNAAADCASDLEHKKAVFGAGNTEDGSKECRPVRDDNHNFSVEEKPQNVKPRPKAYVHADIFPVANLQMKIFGNASELLAILTCLISDLRDAGVPEIELLGAYIINNKRRANAIREKGESDAE